MTDIKAEAAGEALKAIAQKLDDTGVIAPEGRSTLLRVASELKGKKRSKQWPQEVDRGSPVRFNVGKTADNKPVRPIIDFAKIHVNQNHKSRPPFDCFDLAIVLESDTGDLLSRWHIDQANSEGGSYQAGPLFHLQFGGRNNGYDRSVDHPIKEPRWCHPPMDLALSTEMIVANFFEDAWHGLREDPSWCLNIGLFQKLCYEAYLEHLQKCISAPRGSTILNDVWAANWK
ncbi:hypothetical protein EBB79_02935 [Parasedimentitalea marina]|uniref:Uncharacterized protein n=1 Tax=Parasedimentitalea marina TaxID=2483033 RepID=A0A3T0MYW2_9RHOB|nr:hypothetical protein [Parasedimentitalea marina]AZV76951.1 hypothetical protein EBB79_02935 [Parasedimentitalea marina]